jgi:hypothetical protein
MNTTQQNQKLSEYALLLEKFSRGAGTDEDRQEAKRLFLEHSRSRRWIEPYQVYPLTKLVIEGFGGRATNATDRWVLYSVPRWMSRNLSIRVSLREDHSAFVETYDRRGRLETRIHITTGETADNLRDLIQWLRT